MHEAMLHEISAVTVDKASRFLEQGKALLSTSPHSADSELERNEEVQQQQQTPPQPFGVLCFLGGLAVATSNCIGLLNVFLLLREPAAYIMQVFLLLFGLVTMVIEGNGLQWIGDFKPIVSEWFKFVTFPLGKGLFYLFTGAIGLSVWNGGVSGSLIGLYMSGMGILCIIIDVASRRRVFQHNNEHQMGVCAPDATHEIEGRNSPRWGEDFDRRQ